MLCNLKNEGGLQERLDILPILTEESFLKAYPEERKCRAFLEFCGEGDIEAIVDLLHDVEDGEKDDEGIEHQQELDVLRYQDQLGPQGTGLHVAIQNQRLEVAWLLLLLVSRLKFDQFPAEALQAAQNLGIHRSSQRGKPDIRSLKDAKGQTAEDLAASIGGIWEEWVHIGRLRPPNHNMEDAL